MAFKALSIAFLILPERNRYKMKAMTDSKVKPIRNDSQFINRYSIILSEMGLTISVMTFMAVIHFLGRLLQGFQPFAMT